MRTDVYQRRVNSLYCCKDNKYSVMSIKVKKSFETEVKISNFLTVKLLTMSVICVTYLNLRIKSGLEYPFSDT